MLSVKTCNPEYARELNRVWHSRLPKTQRGPWMVAFAAIYKGTVFAVALWNSPSSRSFSSDCIELRRLAVSPDAPHCTASFMLGKMATWFKKNKPQIKRLISYQDVSVHKGTIYKATGWIQAHRSKPRIRDRSRPRRGTLRSYRRNMNGADVDSSEKIRWELLL
jgi:hypothetical protein